MGSSVFYFKKIVMWKTTESHENCFSFGSGRILLGQTCTLVSLTFKLLNMGKMELIQVTNGPINRVKFRDALDQMLMLQLSYYQIE